jgi:hypothetical protein
VLSGGFRRSSRLGLIGVFVATHCNAFEAKSKRVEVRSAPEGIVTSRRKAQPGDWLCDLWVAERLASD